MELWIKIIIGAIFLGIWIANNIREMQKAAALKAEAPPAPPPPEGTPVEATTPAEDLKAFIKQVRRRKEEQQPQPDSSGRDVLVEDPRQIEPPRWEAPPTPTVKPKKKLRTEPAPVVARTAEVTTLSPDFAKFSTKTASPILFAGRPKVASPVVGEVVKLLKSPSGLSTAFLLREILGEPMCKRRPENRRKGI